MAVVVVNYGSHELLGTNTAALGEVPVVVVDNLKSAADREAARELAATHDWAFVEAPSNLGFGGGVNLGVHTAAELGHEAVILLNPDARLGAEAIEAIRRGLADDPLALVSPVVATSTGDIYFWGSAVRLDTGRMLRIDDVTSPPPRTWPWISGACMAFTVRLFEAVGGFDEDYFLYWEDVDFSVRAARHGAHLDVLKDVQAIHDENGTQEKLTSRAKSDLYYQYCARNRLLFAARHLGTRDLLVWILKTPRQSWLILMQGGRRQLLQSRSGLRAVSRGTTEGLALAVREVARRMFRRG
nr:glycosyltransferase family 2 protein [Aeromicrobium duanguangcaii]